MINIQRFITNMYGYIGWQKGSRPTDPKINGTVLDSTSLLYFNSMSNNLELENIQAIAPEYKNVYKTAYDVATSYSIGDIIVYEDDIYTSLTNSNLGNTPSTDLTNWQHNFSKWLEDKTKNSLVKVANKIVSLKQLNTQTKSLLNTVHLFDSKGSSNEIEPKQGRIVGFSFEVKNKEGLMMLLQKVGVQFTAVENLNIYLYHTSQDQPIGTLAVSGNTANRFQWYDFQERMTYEGDYNFAGEYKLVYYEDDLTGNAIKYSLDTTGSNLPCGTCSGGNKSRQYYNNYSPYMTAQPFYVDAANIPVTPLEMWNTDDENNVNLQNWGLNVKIDIKCDITDTITRNKDIFTDFIIMQMEADIAHEAINSTRTSTNKDKVVQNSFLQLEGGERDLKSLTKKIEDEVKKMDFNISSVTNSPCFPCEKKGGVNVIYN